jgi:hypothetical protein
LIAGGLSEELSGKLNPKYQFLLAAPPRDLPPVVADRPRIDTPTDLRSQIETEVIVGDVAQIVAQQPREPLGHAESALETRKGQRCRQADDRVVRLRRMDFLSSSCWLPSATDAA